MVRAADQERVVTSILPSLDYGASCWSSVTLTNLGDRMVTVEIEAHRAGGGLTGLARSNEMVMHLNPGERNTRRLEISDESGVGWLKVRERIPAPEAFAGNSGVWPQRVYCEQSVAQHAPPAFLSHA